MLRRSRDDEQTHDRAAREVTGSSQVASFERVPSNLVVYVVMYSFDYINLSRLDIVLSNSSTHESAATRQSILTSGHVTFAPNDQNAGQTPHPHGAIFKSKMKSPPV